MSTKKKMLWLLSLLPFFIACGDDNTDIPGLAMGGAGDSN